MNTQELKKLSEVELKDELNEMRKEQFNLRIQKSTGQLANTSNLRRVRRGIAKIETLLTELQEKENDRK